MGILDWLTSSAGTEDSSNSTHGKTMFGNIDGAEAARKISEKSIMVLDVRTPREFEQSHIPGAVLIPLQQLPERCGELDPQKEMLVICAHGVRSQQACRVLSQHGFQNLMNVSGGMSSYPGPKQGEPGREGRT
jgi:rhodanese-related sulfurtransferase